MNYRLNFFPNAAGSSLLETMFWTICASGITLVGLTGNVIILTAVYRWKKLHVPSNVLFCFLGVVDTCALPAALTLITVQELSLDVSKTTCTAMYTLAFVTNVLSFGYIHAITFERALAIFKPLFFRRWVTTRKTFLFGISISAVYIPVAGLLIYMMDSDNTICKTQHRVTRGFVYTMTITVCVFTVQTFVMYVAMFVRVSRRTTAMSSVANNVSVVTVSGGSNAANVQTANRTNYRLLRVSVMVVSTTILSWFPSVIFFNLVGNDIATSWPLYQRFGEISRLCPMVNTALDAVIYALMAKNIRKGIKRLFDYE